MAFIRNTLIGAAGAAAIFYHSSNYSTANSGKVLFQKVAPMIEKVHAGKDAESVRIQTFTQFKAWIKSAKDGVGRCQVAMDAYDALAAKAHVNLPRESTTTLKSASTWTEADETELQHKSGKQNQKSRDSCGFKSYISTASDGSTSYGGLAVFGAGIVAVGWALFTYIRDLASKIREMSKSKAQNAKRQRRERDPNGPTLQVNLLDGVGDPTTQRSSGSRRSVEVGAHANDVAEPLDAGVEGMADRDRRDPHSRGSAPTGYDSSRLTTHEDGS